MKRAYHFVGETLRDGTAIPENGEWLAVIPSRMQICLYGLHASEHPFDALKYAPGLTLCLVELDGKILSHKDKVCAERRKIIARFDARELILKFARDCASDVLHLWDAPDVVKEFLQTGKNAADAYKAAIDAADAIAIDAANAAAYNASNAAVCAAAANAANAAAYNAAYAAVYAAYAAAYNAASVAAYKAAAAAAYNAANAAAYKAAAAAAYNAANAAAANAAAAAFNEQKYRDLFKTLVDAEFAKL